MKEFKINDFITLKLSKNGKTNLYVNGELFQQCRSLSLTIPVSEISSFDDIESVDQAAERLDASLERSSYRIAPETEFWGHCSNLQAWAEHEYDTRLLFSTLAFPLLEELAKVGDPMAQKAFKEEIIKRFSSGYPNVVIFLLEGGYFKNLTVNEIEAVLDKSKISKILDMAKDSTGEYERYRIHSPLIKSLKGSSLLKEFSLTFLGFVGNLESRLERKLFRDFLLSAQGIELTNSINSKINKLGDNALTGVESMSVKKKQEGFLELIEMIDGTKLMLIFASRIKTLYKNILNRVESIKTPQRKVELLIPILKKISKVDFFNERFQSLLTIIENMEFNSKIGLFYNLLLSIKDTKLIHIYFTQIKNLYISILTGLEDPKPLRYKINELKLVLDAIEGTDLLSVNLSKLLDIIESMKSIKNPKYLNKSIEYLIKSIKNAEIFTTQFSRINSLVGYSLEKNVIKNLSNIEIFITIFKAIENTQLTVSVNSQITASINDALRILIAKTNNQKEYEKIFRMRDLLDVANNLHMMEEYFPDFLKVAGSIKDKHYKIEAFKYVLESVKDGDILSQYFNSLYNMTCRLRYDTHSDKPFKDFLNLVFNKDLNPENFLEILMSIENMENDVEKFELFSVLIKANKSSELISIYASQINEIVMSVLDGIKGMEEEDYWRKMEKTDAFISLVSALKNTELLKIHILQVIKLLASFGDEREKIKILKKLVNVIEGTNLLIEYFPEFINVLDTIQNRDSFTLPVSLYEIMSLVQHLLKKVKKIDLHKEDFGILLKAVEEIKREGFKSNMFNLLVISFRDTELIKEFPSRLETLGYSIIEILMSRYSWNERQYMFYDFIESIKGTSLMNSFKTEIEDFCLKSLEEVEKIGEYWPKAEKFHLFLKAIRDTDLMVTFNQRIEDISLDILKGIASINDNYDKVETFKLLYEGVKGTKLLISFLPQFGTILNAIINVNTFEAVLEAIKDSDFFSRYKALFGNLILKRIEIIKKMSDFREKADAYSGLIGTIKDTPFWSEYGTQIKSIPVIESISIFDWKDTADIVWLFGIKSPDWEFWEVESGGDDYIIVVANVEPTLEQLKRASDIFKNFTKINIRKVDRSDYDEEYYEEEEKYDWEDNYED
jgi:hypothetical protein